MHKPKSPLKERSHRAGFTREDLEASGIVDDWQDFSLFMVGRHTSVCAHCEATLYYMTDVLIYHHGGGDVHPRRPEGLVF